MEKYDYIICGAGLAGLSLAYRLSNPKFSSKRILLIEKDEKLKNDRTFCHWSTEDGIYEEIVAKKWSKLRFQSLSVRNSFDIHPYVYKMIRGDDFYAWNLKHIRAASHINNVRENVIRIEAENNAIVTTENNSYGAKHIFKTYPDGDIDFSNSQYVSQHFMGWLIKTKEECFNEEEAIFMDFNIPQKNETRFMYVLPSDKNQALVELAIFSNALLSSREYETVLKQYISENLNISNFEIIEKEKGVIPMTSYNFNKHDQKHLSHIGTAGGAVKPSSGYAFSRVQEQSDLICKLIAEDKNLHALKNLFKSKYKRYDRTFLNAILSEKANGEDVFSRMFSKLPAQLIFKFLDEKTSFSEEMKVFTAPPTLPFIRAFIEEF